MFKIKKMSSVAAGIVLLTGICTTSAMAKCGNMAVSKPAPKCGAGKCGASNTIIQGNLQKIEAKMNHLQKLKKEVIRADNMKCGAAKEEAAKSVRIR